MEAGRKGRKLTVVQYRAGAAWSPPCPPEQLPSWDAHAAFVDQLIERGTFVLGGPWSSYDGALIALSGVGADEVHDLLAGDPFVAEGVFVIEHVHEWTMYVDELHGDPPTKPGGTT